MQYASIQVLRGIASLVVFYHHLTGNVAKVLGFESPHQFFSFGFCGVDLFFIISGFIIYKTSSNYPIDFDSFKNYLKKRFTRVFPIYWIVVLPILLTSFLFLKSNYTFTIAEILKTLLLVPHHNAINAVSWTLSYELYFYLIFSLTLLNRFALIIPIVIISLTIFNSITHQFGSGLLHQTDWYFYFSPFNFDFLIGVLIAKYLKTNFLNLNLTIISIVVGIIFLVFFGMSVQDDVSNRRILIFAIPSTIFVISFINLEKQFSVKFPHWLIKIGDASYVLYLIHFPIIILATKFLKKYIHGNNSNILFLIFAGIIIPYLAVIIHKKIEKPLLTYLK